MLDNLFGQSIFFVRSLKGSDKQQSYLQCLQIRRLLYLQFVGLSQHLKLFILLLDNLLILKFDQLPLLLEILNNLSQIGLKKVNFSFQKFDLFVLFKLLDSDSLVVSYFRLKV